MWDVDRLDGSFEVVHVMVSANETWTILVFGRWTWGVMRGEEGTSIV